MIDQTEKGIEESFLSGGGEMGERIRTKDWSGTPLGDVSEWPQNLKTCVRIVLTSRQPMFVWWGPQLINLYNDAYKTIVGGKHPESLGQPAFEVWQEIWDAVKPRAEKVLYENTGTYDEALLLIMERNGYPEETYYTFSYSPVPGENGQAEGIICANTDDTARIIGERQLRTLKDLGKVSIDSKSSAEVYEKTIQVLLENQQDFPFAVLYQIEEEGHLARLVGKTSDDISLVLSKQEIILPVPELDVCPLYEVVRTGETIILELNDSYGPLPSGAWEKSPERLMIIPVAQSGHQLPYALLKVGMNPYRPLDEKYRSFFRLVADQIATNIANVNAYEIERKRAQALTEIDKAKTAFFSNVSHEFRTPLTLMLGPLEEMLHQQEQQLAAPIRENLAATHRNALRLLKLVNALLDFSRIEAGRMQASFQQVDLAGMTQDLASSFRSVMEKGGLVYEVHCEPMQKKTYVDKDMWEKIVLNLISNAFKYTLEGSVKVELRQDAHHAILTVADTGIGIPQSELPKMFERFHRVPNVTGRTHEGTGIGLSLVNELVKMHQGNVSVESSVGRGSVFTISIPFGNEHLPAGQVNETLVRTEISNLNHSFVKEADSLLDNEDELNQAVDSDMIDLPPGEDFHTALHTTSQDSILVVDDNADMRSYLRRLLSPYYTVQTASNGRQAVNFIQQRTPILVISDVMMPEMDGIELLASIKNDPVRSHVPVILLSARAGEEAKLDGLEAGADDYLVKPFSSKELLSRVRSQIKIAHTRSHAEQQLQNLFQQAPVALAIYRGPTFNIEMANELMLYYWDKNIADIINKPLFDVLPEARGQGFEDIMTNVFTTGERYVSGEIAVQLMRSGSLRTIYVKIVLEALRDEQGGITGIMGMSHDITDLVTARQQAQQSAQELEKKVAERTVELVEKNEVLKQQNEFVETILDSSVDMIAVLDKEMRFITLNKKLEEIYNIKRHNLIGKSYVEAFPQARDSKTVHDIRTALQGTTVHNSVSESGVVKGYFENYFIPLKDGNRVYGVLIMAHNITYIMEATHKLREANEELKRTNQELEQFAYVASHDLQEPLRKIQTFTEMLQGSLPVLNQESAMFMTKISQASERMSHLIQDLLNFSRLSNKDETFVSIDLNTIFNEVCNDFELSVQQKEAIIRKDELPVIKGIPLQINQLFNNLLSNALKFSRKDVAPVIHVSAAKLSSEELSQYNDLHPDVEYYNISFTDNGIGFRQEYAEQIFSIFQRLNDQQTYKGTGIGLAICKKIVLNHHGKIMARSKENEGAQFQIILPENPVGINKFMTVGEAGVLTTN